MLRLFNDRFMASLVHLFALNLDFMQKSTLKKRTMLLHVIMGNLVLHLAPSGVWKLLPGSRRIHACGASEMGSGCS